MYALRRRFLAKCGINRPFLHPFTASSSYVVCANMWSLMLCIHTPQVRISRLALKDILNINNVFFNKFLSSSAQCTYVVCSGCYRASNDAIPVGYKLNNNVMIFNL